jgi:acetyltransferase
VTRLVTDFPEIAEMDINPVFAYNAGALALDVKITIS